MVCLVLRLRTSLVLLVRAQQRHQVEDFLALVLNKARLGEQQQEVAVEGYSGRRQHQPSRLLLLLVVVFSGRRRRRITRRLNHLVEASSDRRKTTRRASRLAVVYSGLHKTRRTSLPLEVLQEEEGCLGRQRHKPSLLEEACLDRLLGSNKNLLEVVFSGGSSNNRNNSSSRSNSRACSVVVVDRC